MILSQWLSNGCSECYGGPTRRAFGKRKPLCLVFAIVDAVNRSLCPIVRFVHYDAAILASGCRRRCVLCNHKTADPVRDRL